MSGLQVVMAIVWGFISGSVSGRFGRFRRWPARSLALDEPLALAEERTSTKPPLAVRLLHRTINGAARLLPS